MSENIQIKQIKFNNVEAIDKFSWAHNWPTVYILNGKKEAYVGESYKTKNRLNQHTNNSVRKNLTQVSILVDKEANKSYTLDIESFLIRYMSADLKFKLQNGNNGLVNYNYFNKDKYLHRFKEKIWPQLKKLGLVQKSIAEIENSDLFKFSPYTSLDAYQYEITEAILDELLYAKKGGNIIVRGGPGTGKTLMGVYLMKLLHLTDYHFEDEDVKSAILSIKNKINKIGFVVPQSSLRKTIKRVFRGVDGLSSKMVIGPHEVLSGEYDLLIVDEAHRLRRRVNLSNYGSFDKINLEHNYSVETTELDWIRKNSKYQLFFYDRNQTIKPTDIPEEYFHSKLQGSRLNVFTLQTQFRVLGGDDYLSYIQNILNNQQEQKMSFKNYDIKIYSSFNEFYNEIRINNEKYGLSRLVAGYGWKWVSKKEKNAFDIIIGQSKIKWNSVAVDWVNSENSLEEVGCIHTIQGYDLNYAGVIFGPEISYDEKENKIVIIKENYYDRNGKASIKSVDELENYIKNIYFVLMTRAIKGTYIYICNEPLRNYLKKYFNTK